MSRRRAWSRRASVWAVRAVGPRRTGTGHPEPPRAAERHLASRPAINRASHGTARKASSSAQPSEPRGSCRGATPGRHSVAVCRRRPGCSSICSRRRTGRVADRRDPFGLTALVWSVVLPVPTDPVGDPQRASHLRASIERDGADLNRRACAADLQDARFLHGNRPARLRPALFLPTSITEHTRARGESLPELRDTTGYAICATGW